MSNRIDPSIYPCARRDETVVDDFHGISKIPDPYRWLEDPDSEETQAFVSELNKISEPYLRDCPLRDQLTDKLTQLWNYEKFGCTSIHGSYYYYYHNSGLQNQWVLYQQRSLDDTPGRVFIDPNTLSEDGTTSIRSSKWTVDGSIWAYGLSEKGSDWMTARFKRNDGSELPDVVPGIKHSGLSWLGDNSGVFYSKYPESTKSKEVTTTTEKDKFHSLYFHKLGTAAEDDVLVADFRDNEDFMCSGWVTLDGHYLVVDVSRGCDPTNQLFFHDLHASKNKVAHGGLPLRPLFTKFDAKYDLVDTDVETGTALIMTNRDAPMFKLMRVPMREHDESEWEVVIEEDPKVKLDWVSPAYGGRLLVGYLEDVKDKIYVHDTKSGRCLYKIPTPIGALGGLFCRKDQPLVFFSYESMLSPTTIFKADFSKCACGDIPVEVETVRTIRIAGLDEEEFEVKQVFYPSKDGTRVPMFIHHLKGVKLDGSAPAILYGYGGFNISKLPNFSLTQSLFVKHFGGVFAIANIRGGDEYGERWHEGGMRDRKQNVFDDFIAAAEYLIKEGYTKSERLCIKGGSNGGLLVAACSQQRPDLFGAVVNHVGVLDMLRFHKFTIGGAWLPEFGDPSKADDFPFIYAYSPLHQLHLVDGTEWPATLLLTADHDDRVVPAHTLKYIAQLYHLLKTERGSAGEQPAVMARVEVRAGHGAGKPTAKVIAESVDVFCFLQRALGLEWRA